MRLTRRRFLAVSAATAAAGPVGARPVAWRGRALGAAAEIRLAGPLAGTALDAVRDMLARVEASFSLFDPGSEISRLNRGEPILPSPEFRRLWRDAVAVHALTDGLFDPGIQPRWRALAEGRPQPNGAPGPAWPIWEGERLRLPEGAALTLNGIAQGHASDRVFELLLAMGFSRIVVNVGEFRADAAGAALAIAGPVRQLERVSLSSGALATSSPEALRVGGRPHILHPHLADFAPPWRTVAVEAETAARADALSTALCLAPDLALARRLRAQGALRHAWLEDGSGRLHRL